MEKRKLLAFAALALVAGLVCLFWQGPATFSPAAYENPAPKAAPLATPPTLPVPRLQVTDVRDPSQVRVAESVSGGIHLLPESREIVAELNQPTQPPDHDIEIVENLLATYRTIFGSIPPGGLNREIIAALRGANPRKLAILPPDFSALSPSGELLDRWGTPFLFHPVSDAILEVMSAGPDQALWTPDDVGKITPAGPSSSDRF